MLIPKLWRLFEIVKCFVELVDYIFNVIVITLRCLYKEQLINLFIKKSSHYIYLINFQIVKEYNDKGYVENHWLDYYYKCLVKIDCEILQVFFEYLLGFEVSNISIYMFFDL